MYNRRNISYLWIVSLATNCRIWGRHHSFSSLSPRLGYGSLRLGYDWVGLGYDWAMALYGWAIVGLWLDWARLWLGWAIAGRIFFLRSYFSIYNPVNSYGSIFSICGRFSLSYGSIFAIGGLMFCSFFCIVLVYESSHWKVWNPFCLIFHHVTIWTLCHECIVWFACSLCERIFCISTCYYVSLHWSHSLFLFII